VTALVNSFRRGFTDNHALRNSSTHAAFYNTPFLTASGGTAADAEAALITGLLGEQTYFKIHTVNFGGGEIRGPLRCSVRVRRTN
jgi:hypothetical protein